MKFLPIGSTAALAAIATLTGCQQHSNLRLEIGQAERLPALADATAADAPQADAPSVESLGRENWSTVTYVVPVDGVSHNADWRRLDPDAGSSRRATGAYPTPPEALLLEEASRGEQAWTFLTGPVYGAAELLWMPISAITTPVWGEYWSSHDAYTRSAFPEPLAFPLPTDARPMGQPVERASAIKAGPDSQDDAEE